MVYLKVIAVPLTFPLRDCFKKYTPSFIILILHDYFIFFVVAQEMLGGVDGIYGQGQGPPSVASGPRNYGQGRSRSIIIILYKSTLCICVSPCSLT